MLFNNKKKTDVDDIQFDEDGKPFDKDGNPIDGEVVEFDDEGNPIKPTEDNDPDDKSGTKNGSDEKDALILKLTEQVAAITEQITALKNPVKQQESVKEPELVKPEKPARPKKPSDYNLADQNDVASSTYKYFIEMEEYQNDMEDYRDAMDEYREAKIERGQKLIEQSHQMTQREREAAAVKASMLSKLQAKGLTAEEALGAYDDAISGKLFDEEHIVALKMTERLNDTGNGKNNSRAENFDKLKSKRERFGAIPPIGGNGRNREVLERDDFTNTKDTSHLYRPKQK